jgi:hypothetical protein
LPSSFYVAVGDTDPAAPGFFIEPLHAADAPAVHVTSILRAAAVRVLHSPDGGAKIR